MKQQVLYQKTDTLRLTVYSSNVAVVPSSATIILNGTDGNSVLQSSVAVTAIDSTTGEMTYDLTTTHTASLGLNYKATWAYVVSGVTYYRTQLFDVVRSRLAVPISDEDLYSELQSLRKANVQLSGVATAGAAGSITDTKRKEVDNYWKGGTVDIIAGTGIGQIRNITANTQSTGVITVSPNFTVTPDTTSSYRLVRSYTSAINQSFEKLEQMLYDKGKRDSLIIESTQIRVPLIYLTIHSIAIDLRDEEGDKWDLLQKDYMAKFEKSFNTLTLDYDEDESGGVQGQEVQQNLTSLRIGRA